MSDQEQKLLNSATRIIIRDFDLDEDKANLIPQKDIESHHLKEVLTEQVAYLMDHNMERLKWILYRVDINEVNLHELLTETPPAETASVIAEQIIKRQIEKAQTRELYRKEKL